MFPLKPVQWKAKYCILEKCLNNYQLQLPKTGNIPEKLLNEICQIIYSLYGAKEVNKMYITI